MDCPRCHEPVAESAISCSVCGFAGNGRSLQQWSNLTYLLAEMADWQIPAGYLEPLRQKYSRLLKANEIELGLRPPPPDAAEARLLQEERSRLLAWQNALKHWQSQDWLDAAVAAEQFFQLASKLNAIDERLEDAPLTLLPMSGPKYTLRCLAEQQSVLQMARTLFEAGQISELFWDRISAAQQAVIEALEIEAGLRQPAPRPQAKPISDAAEIEYEPEPVKEKRWQRPSLTWDQVWESLLSERTLHALLFLGVLLLLASVASWVAWNWDTFPPLMQIAFLGSMTAAFFGLGWYVRTRMKLVGSGIALTAVAGLLIPLDFYAFYISGGFPPDSWPTVWLAASVVCLGAYLLVAVLLQAEFFGYLVALALGSCLLAGLNLWNVSPSWWLTAVTGLALFLASANEALRRTVGRWRFLAVPFGHMALLFSVPVMLVGIVYYLVGSVGEFAYFMSLAACWWLGGLTMLVMLRRYRLQTLLWATAVTFPIALWLTMRLLFFIWEIDAAWYALGWLLLAPAYFGAAAFCQRDETDAFLKAAGKTAVIVGALLGDRGGYLVVARTVGGGVRLPAVGAGRRRGCLGDARSRGFCG